MPHTPRELTQLNTLLAEYHHFQCVGALEIAGGNAGDTLGRRHAGTLDSGGEGSLTREKSKGAGFKCATYRDRIDRAFVLACR